MMRRRRVGAESLRQNEIPLTRGIGRLETLGDAILPFTFFSTTRLSFWVNSLYKRINTHEKRCMPFLAKGSYG